VVRENFMHESVVEQSCSHHGIKEAEKKERLEGAVDET
jgi:hypothetical protein